MTPAPAPAATSTRDRLEALYRTFDHVTSASDPVHIVRRYPAAEDREVVGFCAAALAFGRVASVLQSVEWLLAVMGPHPAAFVRRFEPVRHSARIEPLVHRWIRGRDLVALLLILQRMLKESGSIEGFFLDGDDPVRPDVSEALDSFSRRALETNLREVYGRRPPKRLGVCYFFPRPSAGSACKRLNLFLRWRSEEHTSELQSLAYLVCRLLLEKKNQNKEWNADQSAPAAAFGFVRRLPQLVEHRDVARLRLVDEVELVAEDGTRPDHPGVRDLG